MSFPIKWDKPRIPTDEELNQIRKAYNITLLWDGDILLTPKETNVIKHNNYGRTKRREP